MTWSESRNYLSISEHPVLLMKTLCILFRCLNCPVCRTPLSREKIRSLVADKVCILGVLSFRSIHSPFFSVVMHFANVSSRESFLQRCCMSVKCWLSNQKGRLRNWSGWGPIPQLLRFHSNEATEVGTISSVCKPQKNHTSTKRKARKTLDVTVTLAVKIRRDYVKLFALPANDTLTSLKDFWAICQPSSISFLIKKWHVSKAQ